MNSKQRAKQLKEENDQLTDRLRRSEDSAQRYSKRLEAAETAHDQSVYNMLMFIRVAETIGDGKITALDSRIIAADDGSALADVSFIGDTETLRRLVGAFGLGNKVSVPARDDADGS